MSAWCNSCGKILTVDNSYQREMLSVKTQIKKTYMSNVCRPCKTDQAKIRYNLAKIHILVHWIRNACVVGESISCSWITATIPGHIAVFAVNRATWESDTWAIKLRV